jgi:hypothetical protein
VPGPRCAYESGCWPVSRGRSVGLPEFISASFYLVLTYISTFVQVTLGDTPLSSFFPTLEPARCVTVHLQRVGRALSAVDKSRGTCAGSDVLPRVQRIAQRLRRA